jgi:Ferredoxin-like domain in Api92-like protein
MPNWCNNTLELTHKDPEMILRAKNAFEADGLLDEFIPIPYELKQGLNFEDYKKQNREYQDELQDAREKLNMKYFGYKDWYDFSVANWGTKWDVHGEGRSATLNGNTLTLSFDSAWSPPIEAYKKLVEMGFEVSAMYYESGMCYCGEWSNDSDSYIDIAGNSDWVKKNVPSYIDDEFCISEGMAEYEEENAEETE